MREEAKAAFMEFVADVNHSAIPRGTPGKDGVRRVLCKDTRVLRRKKLS